MESLVQFRKGESARQAHVDIADSKDGEPGRVQAYGLDD